MAVSVAIASTILLGCGDAGSAGGGDDTVSRYCAYGAVSEAQLEGCIDHVTSSEVSELNTNAAKFARGSTDRCLSDSGPYCDDVEGAIRVPSSESDGWPQSGGSPSPGTGGWPQSGGSSSPPTGSGGWP